MGDLLIVDYSSIKRHKKTLSLQRDDTQSTNEQNSSLGSAIHVTMAVPLNPHRGVLFHPLSHSLKYRNKMLIDLYFM